jgi:hypothetical protein
MALDRGDQVSGFTDPAGELADHGDDQAGAEPGYDPATDPADGGHTADAYAASTLEREAREAVAAAAGPPDQAPGTSLALMTTGELEELVGTRTVPVREWAASLVQDTEFPDDDPDEMALGILAGILLAGSSEEALAVTNLQRAKELCGNMPGGHSPLLEITAAMPFKSTYEQGAPCYAMVSATVVSTGEKFKFTTGARAVQAVIIAHLVHGWMPFRCLITMRSTPTGRGYYPLNLEAGG